MYIQCVYSILYFTFSASITVFELFSVRVMVLNHRHLFLSMGARLSMCHPRKKKVANSEIYPSASNTIYTMFFAISYAFRVSRASTYIYIIVSKYVNKVYLFTVLSLKIVILQVKISSLPKYPRLNGHNFRFSIQGVNYHSGK